MKRLIILGICIVLSSCEYLGLEKKAPSNSTPIASVLNTYLYLDDVKDLFPKNTTPNDSIVLLKSIINNWATQQLLLIKAQENSSLETNQNIEKLVADYKQSLLINSYKERIVKQQLDTLISDEEIDAYYTNYNQNFRLNEDLVKVKYLHFGNDVFDKDELVKTFKSDKIEDLEELDRQQLSFKSFILNDSTWSPLEKVLLKTPFSRENLLKKTKFIQKEDSLGLYLMTVKDILNRNDIAPKSYIEPTIKQMILHKRKLELIREIEKIIVKDATQNEEFKIYN